MTDGDYTVEVRRHPEALPRGPRIGRLALPPHRREVTGSPALGLCHRRPRRRPLLRRDQLRPTSWKAAPRMAPSAPLWETKAGKLGPARRPHLHYPTRGRVPRARRELLSSLASLQRLTWVRRSTTSSKPPKRTYGPP